MREREVMERAGLLSHLHTQLGRLSRGQRRRVALSRLMLVKKPLWLLDEPAEALDAASVEWLDACIAEHLEGGGIVVSTTHRPLSPAVPDTHHLFLDRSGAWLA
jgi:heme exporter protein A